MAVGARVRALIWRGESCPYRPEEESDARPTGIDVATAVTHRALPTDANLRHAIVSGRLRRDAPTTAVWTTRPRSVRPGASAALRARLESRTSCESPSAGTTAPA